MHKVTENSLKNLETEKYKFTKDNAEIAQKAQRNSVKRRKENKLLKEVAEDKLNKLIKGKSFQELSLDKLIKYCESKEAKPEVIIKILEFLRDTSGQKPTEKQEIKSEVREIPPVVFNIQPVRSKEELETE